MESHIGIGVGREDKVNACLLILLGFNQVCRMIYAYEPFGQPWDIKSGQFSYLSVFWLPLYIDLFLSCNSIILFSVLIVLLIIANLSKIRLCVSFS